MVGTHAYQPIAPGSRTVTGHWAPGPKRTSADSPGRSTTMPSALNRLAPTRTSKRRESARKSDSGNRW